MDNKKIRVAITHGDTNGIGYELIFKAFSEPEMLEFCTPIIYGSPKVAAYYRKAMNLPAQFSIIQKAEDAEDGRINLLAAVDEEVKVDMGLPTDESGAAAIKALDRAMTDYRNNLYDVLITAPVSSQNVKIEGYTFKGHKEYIETCIGDRNSSLSILIGDDLRIAAITEKTPLAQVAGAISQESIVSKTTLLWQTLKRDFLITNPRIAVLALNPSINEEQSCGKEEREIIIPAIDHLADKGIQAFGPYPADEFFGSGYFSEFDGIMAMYYDQATVPFHALYNGWRALHCRLATYPYRSQHNSLLLHGRLQRGRPNIIPPCYLHGTRCFPPSRNKRRGGYKPAAKTLSREARRK